MANESIDYKMMALGAATAAIIARRRRRRRERLRGRICSSTIILFVL